jgi:CubicO group peptidase (beta-lactamase class C family)
MAAIVSSAPHRSIHGGPADSPLLGRSLSRRDFVRSAGLAAVGLAAPFSFVRTASARTDRLHRYLQQKLTTCNTPSIAVTVVRGEEIVFADAVGWADKEHRLRATPQTPYMLASVSKTITCAGIMALVEDGRLDLDADINEYLPFQVHVPKTPNLPVTMRMLLTHTSAIRDRWQVWGTPWSDPTLYFHGDSPISLGDFCRSYYEIGGSEYQSQGNFYERPPGTKYAYSNLAVALAGYVAEAVSGVDFDEWCLRRIFRPLAMSNSGFRLADVDASTVAMPYTSSPQGFDPIFQYGYPDYPDGEVRTSAKHLARWLGALMNLGEFQGTRVLDVDTVKEIRRNQIADLVGWRQGLIWFGEGWDGFSTLGHDGGDYGVSTRMFFRPDRRVGVVTLTNSYLNTQHWTAFSDIEARMFAEFS